MSHVFQTWPFTQDIPFSPQGKCYDYCKRLSTTHQHSSSHSSLSAVPSYGFLQDWYKGHCGATARQTKSQVTVEEHLFLSHCSVFQKVSAALGFSILSVSLHIQTCFLQDQVGQDARWLHKAKQPSAMLYLRKDWPWYWVPSIPTAGKKWGPAAVVGLS